VEGHQNKLAGKKRVPPIFFLSTRFEPSRGRGGILEIPPGRSVLKERVVEKRPNANTLFRGLTILFPTEEIAGCQKRGRARNAGIMGLGKEKFWGKKEGIEPETPQRT